MALGTDQDKQHHPPASGTRRGGVVVTGASTGIGYACAIHLDRIGFRVFAGVRRDEDAERLRSQASERLVPVKIDVTDSESIRNAALEVATALGSDPLNGLVNNAGIAVSGPVEYLPIEEVRKQLEVNYIGQVAVTQTFLPLLRRAHGRVVNIGSVGGEVALPFLSPYAASKHAIEGFSDSLRREVEPLGVRVSVVRPGAIQSSIWERGNAAADEVLARVPPEALKVYGDAVRGARAAANQRAQEAIPAQEVADVVEHALTADKPKTRYVVGRTGKVMVALERWLPDRAFDRLVARAMRG
jgi:NAD(P)-dependent dehydrogenase (short-subunit alcohol dehydrogenase family)